MRNSNITFSEELARKNKQEQVHLEFEKLETNINTAVTFERYNICENKLDTIHEHMTEEIKIMSNCQLYEHGEKSAIFFC